MRKLIMTVLLVFSCTSLALAQDDYHKVEFFAGYSYNSVDKIAGSELFSTTTFDPSIVNLGNSLAKRKGLRGFDTSVTYNFSRYVGAKFDFSFYKGAEGNKDLNAPGEPTGTLIPSSIYIQPGPLGGTLTIPAAVLPTRHSSYSFLGGVQIKDNSKDKRIKPFAHFLLGVARQNVSYIDEAPNACCQKLIVRPLGTEQATNNGFSWALGGGLDIRVHRRIDLRVLQFDYNPVRTKEQTLLAIGDIRDFSDFWQAAVGEPRFRQASALSSIGVQGRTQHNFRISVGIVFH